MFIRSRRVTVDLSGPSPGRWLRGKVMGLPIPCLLSRLSPSEKVPQRRSRQLFDPDDVLTNSCTLSTRFPKAKMGKRNIYRDSDVDHCRPGCRQIPHPFFFHTIILERISSNERGLFLSYLGRYSFKYQR